MVNMAGISEVKVALVSDVTYMGISANVYLTEDIELETDAEWYTFSSIYSTGNLTTSPRLTTGKSYGVEGSFTIAKGTAENIASVDQFTDEEVIILVTDFNGIRWVMGTPDFPANVSWSFKTGANPTERNEIQVSISAEQRKPIPVYNPYNYIDQEADALVFQNEEYITLN